MIIPVRAVPRVLSSVYRHCISDIFLSGPFRVVVREPGRGRHEPERSLGVVKPPGGGTEQGDRTGYIRRQFGVRQRLHAGTPTIEVEDG